MSISFQNIEFEKNLGAGGYGFVFLVHLKNNPNQKFALKAIKLENEDYKDNLALSEVSEENNIKYNQIYLILISFSSKGSKIISNQKSKYCKF